SQRRWVAASAGTTKASLPLHRHAEELFLELVQAVAQLGRALELEVPRRFEHLALDALQLALEVLLRHGLVLGVRLRGLELLALLVDVVHAVDDVLDALLHAL